MQAHLREFCSRNAKTLRRLNSQLQKLADDPYNRRPLSAAAKTAEVLEKESAQTGLKALKSVAGAMRHTLHSCNRGLSELNPGHLQALAGALDWLQLCMQALQKSRSEIALPAKDWLIHLQDPERLAPNAVPSPDEKLNPNDLAALLVQLDPDDDSGLDRIQKGLRALAASQPDSSQAVPLLESAAHKLKQASQCDSAADRDDLLTEAGLCIDAASDTMEAAPGSASLVVDGEVQGQEKGSRPESEAAACCASGPPSDGQEDQEAATAAAKPLLVQLPPDADIELIAEFITESLESIDAAEASLLDLETSPQNAEAINTVFRSFHTIKGTSAFLGLDLISHLAHLAENLLSRIREQEIVYSGGYADLALRSIDVLKELLQAVQDALDGQSTPVRGTYHDLIALLKDPEAHGISDECLEDERPSRLGDILVYQGKADRDEVEAVASCKGEEPLGRALVKSGTAKVSDVARALRSQKRSAGPDSSVRVKTGKLDRVIDMVGELVIAHSMIAQDESVLHRANFETTRKVIRAGKIVRELQDLCMSLRMIPMRAVFQKMARLVRDLSRKTGKQVEFITEGEETEIDRNLVDIIGDPLVHMVRNAVDHGIELPEERMAAGKPATGQVSLRAFHEGGNVIVELKDDGRGLNREKIAAKALAKNLLDSADGLSDREIYDLIFAPGFSTASQVTDVSGRGVGMDVVKRSIESLRGRVQIASKRGQGTSFTIVLPLTLRDGCTASRNIPVPASVTSG